MELKPYQNKILDLYLEQELLLAKLYKLLAEKFPDHKEFWDGMQGEELEHAAWIKKLHEDVVAGGLTFSEGKTRSYTLQAYITYMNGVIRKTGEKDFTLKKAVALSLDVENSLIENNVFAHFEGDSDRIRSTLQVLREGTARHIGHVKKYASQVGIVLKK